MILPSKELLSEVLKDKEILNLKDWDFRDNEFYIVFNSNAPIGNANLSINVYQLEYMVKEWAYEKRV